MELDVSHQADPYEDERVSAKRQRKWTAAEKLVIVEESYSASGTVSATAQRHGISSSTLSRWRSDCREGRLDGDQPSGFVPAQVVAEASCAAASGVSGRMEIMSANGWRVVVGNDFDGRALSRLLDVVEVRR